MISHYLLNKKVSWFTLQKIRLGKSVEYIRRLNYGTVKDITSCGGLCLVIDDDGNRHEVETPELEEI